MKNNRLISILLLILIILSGANLLVGVSNTVRIRQLESAPPVVIEEIEDETEITTTEKQTMTFRNKEETTAETTSQQKEPSEEKEGSTEAKAEEPTSEAQNSSVCYVTSSGTKYHRDGCSYLKKSKTKMTVQEAKDCGYSPCSRCYP